MTEIQDKDQLETAVGLLTRLLFSEEGLNGTMRRIADLAVAAIPACDSSSVTQIDGQRILLRAGTDDLSERLDALQYDGDDGPCVEAIKTGRPTKIESVDAEVRWPAFTRRAAEAGLQSSFSVPLRVGGRLVGALNLYSLASPFLPPDELVSEQFAHQAAITLANAEAFQRTQDLVANLRIALESRDVIGQAKGIIMERERITSDRAFEVLRSVSQSRNVKVRDLAQQVVDTGTWGEELK
jgi:GAF domain-containing protein